LEEASEEKTSVDMRLWDVLPPVAKKDVLCSIATLPELLFTRVHKTGIDGQIKEGYSLPLKGC